MKRLLIFFFLAIAGLTTYGQFDPLYNQYLFNQMLVNPAYAGIYNRFSATIISRVQWAGIEGAPTTNTLTVQSSLFKGQIGLGGILIQDQLGINKNTEGQFVTSYNIHIGEAKLAMGLQGGFVSSRFDLSKLTLDYVDDERLVNGFNNFSEPNFGGGIMLMSPKYFAGFSVPRILNLTIEDGVVTSTRYKRHFYVSGGYFLQTSRFTYYRFSTLVHYVQGDRLSFDLNLSTYLDETVWAGFTARNLRDFGAYVILELGNNLKLGYSFEMPTSSLVQSNYGTHELSISFDASLSRDRAIIGRRF